MIVCDSLSRGKVNLVSSPDKGQFFLADGTPAEGT